MTLSLQHQFDIARAIIRRHSVVAGNDLASDYFRTEAQIDIHGSIWLRESELWVDDEGLISFANTLEPIQSSYVTLKAGTVKEAIARSQKTKVRRNFTLSPDIANWLDSLGVNRSRFVENLLREAKRQLDKTYF
jgi:hypothetical protein